MKKSYSIEFKKQAAELAQSLGSNIAAARQLGISDGAIKNWRTKFGRESKPVVSGTPNLSSADLDELKRLRKEVGELKKVNQILKVAAAFFSQDSLK